MLRKVAIAISLASALIAGAGAQKLSKQWTEWSKQDAEKMLNDSPWGRTQIETDISEMFFTPTTQGQGRAQNTRNPANTAGSGAPDPLGSGRAAEGALNQATSVKFHVRWLSAKPIRQAMAREVSLQGDGKITPQLKAFVDSPSGRRTVIAVTFEATDQRFGGKVMQAFNSAVTSSLKNQTYLERKDGQRIFLAEYVPPQGNALAAAMFVFPRMHGEGPLLTPDAGEVRFVSEMTKAIKLDMKFKVSEMIYNGRLEY